MGPTHQLMLHFDFQAMGALQNTQHGQGMQGMLGGLHTNRTLLTTAAQMLTTNSEMDTKDPQPSSITHDMVKAEWHAGRTRIWQQKQ